MRAITICVLALIVTLAGLGPARPVAAQIGQRCFPETGYCIAGAIRDYWEDNGGLAVFGYPIGPLQHETVEGSWTGPVQWFERDRLEDHANEGLGVLAGRLGARALELRGIDWRDAAPDGAAFPGCRYFRETGFNLCGAFLRYWEQNGGLERFGYPITRERDEVVEGGTYTVQYFERRRMELHPENAGTPFEVLLGLLGKQVRAGSACLPWFFSPAPEQCPLTAASSVDGAAQRFEHGVMFWTREPDAFTIVADDGRYWIVRAPYSFATPARDPGSPPAGRYAPVSGFGDLWRGRIVASGPSPLEAPLFTILGWAVEPERGARLMTQCQRARFYNEQGCYFGAADGPIIFYGPGGSQIVR